MLADAVERRLPTLGLCLGAQLLAQVLGARVERLSEARIGWFELGAKRHAKRDPVYSSLPRRLHVFEWHSYGFDLPPGAALLAGTRRATQAFAWDGHAWGLQFHLEATERIIREWISHYAQDLRRRKIDAELLDRETLRRAALYRHRGEQLGRRFASRVSEFALARDSGGVAA